MENDNIKPEHPGEIIKRYIEHLRITQREFSKNTNISEGHLSNIIRGINGLSENVITKINKTYPHLSHKFLFDLQKNYDKALKEYLKYKKKTIKRIGE